MNKAEKSSQDTDTARQPIGEVLSSTVTGLVAQSWQDTDQLGLPVVSRPRFGSFLKIHCTEQNIETIAVVYNVITGSPDTVHKPSALRMSRQQLRIEQPHIFALLRTEVHAATIGYRRAGRTYSHLPPQPPDVHDFVYQARQDEIQDITSEFDFLRMLSNVSDVPSDELIAAAIREASLARNKDRQYLIQAGQSLSYLMRADYDKLILILRKIRPDTID